MIHEIEQFLLSDIVAQEIPSHHLLRPSTTRKRIGPLWSRTGPCAPRPNSPSRPRFVGADSRGGGGSGRIHPIYPSSKEA